jgi:hypothetical protein
MHPCPILQSRRAEDVHKYCRRRASFVNSSTNIVFGDREREETRNRGILYAVRTEGLSCTVGSMFSGVSSEVHEDKLNEAQFIETQPVSRQCCNRAG